MQPDHQADAETAATTSEHQRVDTVRCPRRGCQVAVTFETSDGPIRMRTDVVACPLKSDEENCDLACLSPVGGQAYYCRREKGA